MHNSFCKLIMYKECANSVDYWPLSMPLYEHIADIQCLILILPKELLVTASFTLSC